MNKTALITGGGRGLGRDMAINLAKQGFDSVITYFKNKQKADEVVSEIESLGQKAWAIQLDTRDVSTFDQFAEDLKNTLKSENGNGKIDFLVNNAGTGEFGLVEQTTEEVFDEMMNVHFKGVFFLTQKLLPQLNDHGRIINVSSGLTRFSFPGCSAYASMKGAVEVFTRYLAKELGNRNITANVLAPGAIATEFAGGTNRDDEGKRNVIAGMTALGRVGEAEDIGGIVAFLCSDNANWINGQRIEASGGMLI